MNFYFDTYIGVTDVGNERYGEIEAKHKLHIIRNSPYSHNSQIILQIIYI